MLSYLSSTVKEVGSMWHSGSCTGLHHCSKLVQTPIGQLCTIMKVDMPLNKETKSQNTFKSSTYWKSHELIDRKKYLNCIKVELKGDTHWIKDAL